VRSWDLDTAVDISFVRSAGPGGQNVNKVATAAQLRFHVGAFGQLDAAAARLKVLAGSRWTMDGGILVTARTHRTREANREEARRRLAELVAEARIRPERRIKTKPSRAAKARRVEAKARTGEVKKNRAKPRLD